MEEQINTTPPIPETMNESITPHAQPEAHTQAQMASQEVDQSLTVTQEEYGHAKERAVFDLHVRKNGIEIPSNFKDAGSWFDSLKEAQKQYTQARQEISDLKKTYEEGTQAVNPNYVEPTQEPAIEAPKTQVKAEETKPSEIDELRIPMQSEEPQKETTDAAQKAWTSEDYQTWSLEAATTGDLTQETRSEITAKTGFTSQMIDDFLVAQRAKAREAYGKAAEKVGGKEHLSKIFGWASKNLSKEQQIAVNEGLASPNYEITLKGLASMYEEKTKATPNPVATAKAQEPAVSANRVPNPAGNPPQMPYRTRREFYADRNNPRYSTDTRFREQVDLRLQRTDFSRLPK